jgi:DNA-binding transcriptional ArsR family regulator
MDDSVRRLRDARELKALAHPVRMRLQRALYDRGSATATELAEMIGESPANCSWHLRQLAKYGFVEEAGGGTGRNRPWRPVARPLSWSEGDETGEVAAAGDHLSSMFHEQEFAGLRDWHTWWRTDPPEWREAANFTQSLAWLTAGELAELNEALVEVVMRYGERVRDPAERPPEARQVRIFAFAVPAAPLPAGQAADDADDEDA